MSTPSAPLQELAMAHGVHLNFHDLHGHLHPTGADTLRALLAALGVDASSEPLIKDALHAQREEASARLLAQEHVLQTGQTHALRVSESCDWVLLTEDGHQITEGFAEADVKLPALQVGYYVLTTSRHGDAQTSRLLVRPVRAPDVFGQTGRTQLWGMTGALYGLRSDSNGGLGNFADLGTACAALGDAGAQFFGINPIHALGWACDDMISPYSPTHRGFFNIDYIAVEKGLGPSPAGDLIDYADFRSRHRAALEAAYKAHTRSKDAQAFESWDAEQPDDLHDFTHFEALSEQFGRDFRQWPAELRRPGSAAAKQAGHRAKFHAWLQWRAETQIDAAQSAARGAGMSLGLYLDLAVGPRPDGAEVWMNQDTIAKGITIGAPPDHLSPEGQSWALAAHAPGPLSQAFYAPLRAMLRKMMSRCGLLRIDHVLGLMRSFWLPDDGSPGGYVSQPLESLLAIIAIEADRAGCVVVGEDLGLVPDGFRSQLNAAGLYSYAVWQYETFHDGHIRPAEALSPHSLACFGTHDTPTLKGFWFGEDIDLWQRVGWTGGQESDARHAQRARQRHSLRAQCDIAQNASPADIAHAVQHKLAQAPAALLAVQLDDALGLTDAQNLPGTIDEHPNWRRRLPLKVEDFATAPDFNKVRDAMPEQRR